MRQAAPHVGLPVAQRQHAREAHRLGLRRGERRAGYVTIPLDLRSRYGLAVLSIIISSAPGTLWIQYDSHSGHLLLHVLDLVDGNDWVRRIKDRYERPLMEIFS